MDSQSLPQGTSVVKLDLLDGGSFTADVKLIHEGAETNLFRMYSWAFHIYHAPSKRHVVWDVGISSDPSEYTTFHAQFFIIGLKAESPKLSLPQQLSKRGIPPGSVDSVIFSHHHWDHARPIARMFPEATGLFGPGTFKHCTPGLFHDDPYDEDQGRFDANFFHPTRATERARELEGEWVPFGSFEKALDFFGDGSFWIVQAPGHTPGNLLGAARVGENEWVILASDCCHSKALYDGTKTFATWKSPTGSTQALHEDLPAAQDTLQRLRTLEKRYGAHIAMAHDVEWMKEGKDEVLLSLLDESMHDFVKHRLPSQGLP